MAFPECGMTIGDKAFLAVYVRLDPKNKTALYRAWREAHAQEPGEEADRGITRKIAKLLDTIEGQEFIGQERSRLEREVGKIQERAGKSLLITIEHTRQVDWLVIQRIAEALAVAQPREVAELAHAWNQMRDKLPSGTAVDSDEARHLIEAEQAARREAAGTPTPPKVSDVDPIEGYMSTDKALGTGKPIGTA